MTQSRSCAEWSSKHWKETGPQKNFDVHYIYTTMTTKPMQESSALFLVDAYESFLPVTKPTKPTNSFAFFSLLLYNHASCHKYCYITEDIDVFYCNLDFFGTVFLILPLPSWSWGQCWQWTSILIKSHPLEELTLPWSSKRSSRVEAFSPLNPTVVSANDFPDSDCTSGKRHLPFEKEFGWALLTLKQKCKAHLFLK